MALSCSLLRLLFFVLFHLTPVTPTADGCVVVTGATGWVAGHIIEVLFSKGYTVHGTVRNATAIHKHQHLLDLETKYRAKGAQLHLFNADLFAKNPYDAAAKGCVAFLHVASVVVKEDANPQVQVDGAVQGTLSALEASQKANIKHVVVTSSVAALSPTTTRLAMKLSECDRAYDTTDTNNYAHLHLNTYSYSKTRAEKKTNEWMALHDNPFRLATTHFAMAWGPQQAQRVTSSQNAILVVAKREWPFYAPLYFHGVDVRDVARAHVHLLENTRAQGRYIIALDQTETAVSMYDINAAMKEDPTLYNQLHWSMDWKLSAWAFGQMLWINPLLDPSMLVAAKRGHGCGFDGTRLSKELGFVYQHTSMQQTIRDSARSMVALKLAGLERPKWHWVGVGVVMVVAVFVVKCCRVGRSGKTKEE